MKELVLKSGHVIYLDDDIYEEYKDVNWRVNYKGNVVTSKLNGKREVSLMSLVFTESKKNNQPRYKDGNKLNLTRENITNSNIVNKEYIEDYVIATTSKGKKFLISLEDDSILDRYKFAVNKYGYVSAMRDGLEIYLHRLLMNCNEEDLVVDHMNINPLDNRRCNLRVCDRSQNLLNIKDYNFKNKSSRFRGLTKTPSGKWQVALASKRFGLYKNEKEGALAFNYVLFYKSNGIAPLNDIYKNSI